MTALRRIVAVVAAVLAVAAVGAAAGWYAGRSDRPTVTPPPSPIDVSSAAPVPALPELPIAQNLPFKDDIDYPALPTGLRYLRHRVAGAGHTWWYDAPAGWKEYPGSGEDPKGTVRWRPADEPETGGYVLRVLPIQPRNTPADELAHRRELMERYYRDVRVIQITDDSVWFYLRSNGNLKRYNYFAWVTVPGMAYAGFELSVAGRDRDQDGLAELLEKVQKSVRMVR
ncbi:hypothetical protein [Nocardioides sp. KR10-350]|uniref:hypothetical protein n=1 Tax=Nocardioides cheoyonin TaxID=3156615 RepID=UPI0032B37C0A